MRNALLVRDISDSAVKIMSFAATDALLDGSGICLLVMSVVGTRSARSIESMQARPSLKPVIARTGSAIGRLSIVVRSMYGRSRRRSVPLQPASTATAEAARQRRTRVVRIMRGLGTRGRSGGRQRTDTGRRRRSRRALLGDADDVARPDGDVVAV